MKQLKAFSVYVALTLAAAGVIRADEAAPVAAPAAPAEPSGKPEVGHEATPPPTKDWSVTVGADWFSEYIFRGVNVLGTDNMLFNPSAIAKYKNFGAYYYGYYGYGKDARPGNQWYEENDYAADYTQTLFKDKLALTAGGYWYTYPDAISGNDTFEFYGKAQYNEGILNPYIGINWDIDSFHGGYGVAGVTHTFDLSKPMHLPGGQAFTIVPMAQLGIDFGYNSRATQANVNFNDALLGVLASYNITPQFCIHAGFQVSIAMNSLNDIGQRNERIGNAGLSYSF
jgi:hypothetical protein